MSFCKIFNLQYSLIFNIKFGYFILNYGIKKTWPGVFSLLGGTKLEKNLW